MRIEIDSNLLNNIELKLPIYNKIGNQWKSIQERKLSNASFAKLYRKKLKFIMRYRQTLAFARDSFERYWKDIFRIFYGDYQSVSEEHWEFILISSAKSWLLNVSFFTIREELTVSVKMEKSRCERTTSWSFRANNSKWKTDYLFVVAFRFLEVFCQNDTLQSFPKKNIPVSKKKKEIERARERKSREWSFNDEVETWKTLQIFISVFSHSININAKNIRIEYDIAKERSIKMRKKWKNKWKCLRTSAYILERTIYAIYFEKDEIVHVFGECCRHRRRNRYFFL